MENETLNRDIAEYIDHTLLKPDASFSDIQKLVAEAIEYKFFSVCVNPCYVATCAELLKGTSVKVCTVIGFPLGATSTAVKAFETKKAIDDGADEIDMVINIGALKSKKFLLVEDDISEVVKVANDKVVKVIIETALLTDEEIVKASQLSEEAGAHFVKTSTGFNGPGATLEGVKLMGSAITNKMRIKASGGIRDYETAMKFIAAGASRLGTSSGVSIVNHQKGTNSY